MRGEGGTAINDYASGVSAIVVGDPDAGAYAADPDTIAIDTDAHTIKIDGTLDVAGRILTAPDGGRWQAIVGNDISLPATAATQT